jgi:hypothetical protein
MESSPFPDQPLLLDPSKTASVVSGVGAPEHARARRRTLEEIRRVDFIKASQ